MKPLLSIILFLSVTSSSGQNYSRPIKDTAIINFMSWLFKNDTGFKAVRHVNNKILKWHSANVQYFDTTKTNDYQFTENIFANHSGLAKLLNKQDADFFVQQVKGQQKPKWNLNEKLIKLYDTFKLIDNHLDTALFSYSLPLFSVNKNYVVIIEAFYCGLVCGGGSYNLYKREPVNGWKKIKTFNEWAE